MKGLVVIPARNEAATIAETLARLAAARLATEIVVVDDGSADETADRAVAAGAAVIRHPFWLGYGAALQTGFKYAVARDADWVATLDADGQHDPAFLEALVAPVAAGEADIAIGSRFLHDPGFPLGALKRAGVIFFRGVVRVLTGRVVTDPTSGFKCLGRGAYRFCARDVFPHDYPDTDMVIALHKARFRIVERPARMTARRAGRSMHAGVLGPLYYVLKVSVSILATVFRESHAYLGEPWPEEASGAPSPDRRPSPATAAGAFRR